MTDRDASGRDDRQRIEEYLPCHNTMTLATCSDGAPWAAAVFYAHDADLTFYFKSSPKSRHIQDIIACPDVAATVQEDGQDWKTLCGVQMIGFCSRVKEHDLARVNRCYIEKFPFLAAVTEHAGDVDEAILAERLESTPFYQLQPRWIRFIDNARGFGHKTEIRLVNP